MKMTNEKYVSIFDLIMIAIYVNAFYIKTGIFRKFVASFSIKI